MGTAVMQIGGKGEEGGRVALNLILRCHANMRQAVRLQVDGWDVAYLPVVSVKKKMRREELA